MSMDRSKLTGRSTNIEDRRWQTSTYKVRTDDFENAGNRLTQLKDQFVKAAPPGVNGQCPVISVTELRLYREIESSYSGTMAYSGRLFGKIRLLDNPDAGPTPNLSSVDACSGAYKAQFDWLGKKSFSVDALLKSLEARFFQSKLAAQSLANRLETDSPLLNHVSVTCDSLRSMIRSRMRKNVLLPHVDGFGALHSQLGKDRQIIEDNFVDLKKSVEDHNCYDEWGK